jgi:hypothetical protein
MFKTTIFVDYPHLNLLIILACICALVSGGGPRSQISLVKFFLKNFLSLVKQTATVLKTHFNPTKSHLNPSCCSSDDAGSWAPAQACPHLGPLVLVYVAESN